MEKYTIISLKNKRIIKNENEVNVMVKVYIKSNENHEITEVGSSVFIEDTTGWTLIDEGSGDKYVHAQNNYFEKPLRDEEGNYNYLFINGKVYERWLWELAKL